MKTKLKFDRDKSYASKVSHRNNCEDRKSEMSISTRTRSQMQQETKLCRSEMNMTVMSEQNKEKLFDIFLPDIRRMHTQIGYTHRVDTFNLNQENLHTVQIRAKTAWCKERELKEHHDVTLGSGGTAANSVTPRPCWGYKALPSNHMNGRLFLNDTQSYSAYVKRQRWYIDTRGSQRPLPRNQYGKATKM